MIILFLVPVSLMMHDVWAIDDPQERMSEMINFSKNMAKKLRCVRTCHSEPENGAASLAPLKWK